MFRFFPKHQQLAFSPLAILESLPLLYLSVVLPFQRSHVLLLWGLKKYLCGLVFYTQEYFLCELGIIPDVNFSSGFHFVTHLILSLWVVAIRRTQSGTLVFASPVRRGPFYSSQLLAQECCVWLGQSNDLEQLTALVQTHGFWRCSERFFSFIFIVCPYQLSISRRQEVGLAHSKSLTHNWCPSHALSAKSGPCWGLGGYISSLSILLQLQPKFTHLADILFVLWVGSCSFLRYVCSLDYFNRLQTGDSC